MTRGSHRGRRRRPPVRRSQTRTLLAEVLETRRLLASLPVQFADLEPGIDSSFPSDFAKLGDNLFSLTNDALWQTNGLDSSPVLIHQKTQTDHFNFLLDLTVFDNHLVFAEFDPGEDFFPGSTDDNLQVWKSDGTQGGTALVKDFGLGSRGTLSEGTYFTPSGGTLFFVASDQTNGDELWKTDLTEDGTVLVKDIEPGIIGGAPYSLTDVNGTLFFSAEDTAGGNELWKSDGTSEGTTRVTDLVPGGMGSYPLNLTPFNGGVAFSTRTAGDDNEIFTGDDHLRWWHSDGSAQGTTLIKDFGSGSHDYGGYLSAVNGQLFGTVRQPDTGSELWVSDGTESGTTLLKDIEPGENSSYPSGLHAQGGLLFFSASNEQSGQELWRSDGTAAGTVLVKDIAEGATGSYPYGFARANGQLFFSASSASGNELWRTDGTAQGTIQIGDIFQGPNGSYPSSLTTVNGLLLFGADDGISGSEPWGLKPAKAWENAVRPTDVNGDGDVIPFDVLVGINELNDPRFSDPTTGRLNDERPLNVEEAYYFDVNGDGFATPGDILIVINFLNSGPAIKVTPVSGPSISEADTSSSVSFTVELTTQPTANVTIDVTSSDTTEASVSTDQLTFTPQNWNTPQEVTITAEDDTLFDNDQSVTIELGIASSTDADYGGLDPNDVTVTTLDDEIPFFSGNYLGTYTGTATIPGVGSRPESGDVEYNVNGLNITLTKPSNGTGTINEQGDITFGVVSDPEIGTCTFTGSFTRNGVARADGNWSCNFPGGSANGTWQASKGSGFLAEGEGMTPPSDGIVVEIDDERSGAKQPILPLLHPVLRDVQAPDEQLVVELGDLPPEVMIRVEDQRVIIDRDANGRGWSLGKQTEEDGPVDLMTALAHALEDVPGGDAHAVLDQLYARWAAS